MRSGWLDYAKQAAGVLLMLAALLWLGRNITYPF
jgi:hypothetical protein